MGNPEHLTGKRRFISHLRKSGKTSVSRACRAIFIPRSLTPSGFCRIHQARRKSMWFGRATGTVGVCFHRRVEDSHESVSLGLWAMDRGWLLLHSERVTTEGGVLSRAWFQRGKSSGL